MPPIRFGSCVLDLDARQLFRGGQPVHLSPKAFELLKILVSARPKAISKAELHERIWPGTFVTDDSLARLVTEARAAIGDHARTPTFLRTVHAFGYAFAGVAPEGTRVDRPAAEPTCWLVYEGRALALADGENIIGRDPGARVTLDSIRVSRRHARVTVSGRSATIEDLGSRNGTLLNGERTAGPVGLTDGDEITIGGFALKFRAALDAQPTEPDTE
ncbi:MAG TPA: FHA domain-containing protein [Vicinamibacterales bacterium]|nr:FHA domain-containing protein [Vicinamibacterales bacterium]